MKSIKVLFSALIAILLFSSCGKNEYICACQISYGGPSLLYENIELGRVSNNKAQKQCNNHQLSRAEELKGTGNVIQCRVID